MLGAGVEKEAAIGRLLAERFLAARTDDAVVSGLKHEHRNTEVPVWAEAMTSRFWMATGIACPWTGDGCL